MRQFFHSLTMRSRTRLVQVDQVAERRLLFCGNVAFDAADSALALAEAWEEGALLRRRR